MTKGAAESQVGKIVPLDQAVDRLNLLPTSGITLVGGCFDILHYGHVKFLREAAEIGSALVVALESDEFIRKHKHREPVHTQLQRAEILAALTFVDAVIMLPLMNGDADYRMLVTTVKPSVIGLTAGDPMITRKQEHAAAVGGTVVTVCDPVDAFSSTQILTYATILSD